MTPENSNIDDTSLELELRKEILLGFHTQFAENQRSREGTFLQFLALLGAALAGYAFLFRTTKDTSYSASAVMFFQLAISGLLFTGARLVVVISNNFRRDQFVNVRIRQMSQLIGSKAIFPESYDPRNGLMRWGLVSWMPDFFQALFFLFVVFQVAGLVAFRHLLKLRFGLPFEWGITSIVLISGLLALWSTLVVPWKYRAKLLPIMELDPTEFGVAAAIGRRWDGLTWKSAKTWWESIAVGFRHGQRDQRTATTPLVNRKEFTLTLAGSTGTTMEEQLVRFRSEVEEAAKAAGLRLENLRLVSGDQASDPEFAEHPFSSDKRLGSHPA